jgi:hypothetical protein
MAKKFYIGDKNFETKKDAEEFIRTILCKYQFDQPLDDSDFIIVSDLLDRHPESDIKKGVGVKSIIVRQDQKFGTTRHFCLVRLDDSIIDFSIGKCFSSNPNTPIKLFKSCARRAVENQVIYFINSYFAKHQDSSGKVICAITGVAVDKDNASVDHTPPTTFDNIVLTFIQANNLDLDKVVFTSADTYKVGKEFTDEKLKTDFANYHKQVAKLRITTRTANLKQKKKAW